MSMRLAVASFVLLINTLGCAGRRDAVGPRPPSLTTATSQTRCAVRRSADKPLVVEWPAADRAALEARAHGSLVAVRYSGCEMEVLSECDVDGAYAFVPLSRKQERVTIRSADELYARLPVGAAALEGKLEHEGELVVDMTIVGRKQADRYVFSRSELHGRCDTATHVLTGLTVGAFSLYAGARVDVAAGVRFASASMGGAHERSRELLARDGDPAGCEAIDQSDATGTPPPMCGALLRVEAVPLVGGGNGESPVSSSSTLQPVRHPHRAAAWRATAATSWVLAGAATGSLLGGVVLIQQSHAQPFWEELTPENARKESLGTKMVIGSSVSVIALGSLAISASVAARRAESRRYAWVAPSIDRTSAGLRLGMRF